MQVLDLPGFSGAIYRFRKVTVAHDLPANAGNFVVSRRGDAVVLACGTRRSLAELGKVWRDLTARDAEVFVRLNVGRNVRLAEHADLVESLKPQDVLPEPD